MLIINYNIFYTYTYDTEEKTRFKGRNVFIIDNTNFLYQ